MPAFAVYATIIMTLHFPNNPIIVIIDQIPSRHIDTWRGNLNLFDKYEEKLFQK